MQIEKNQENFQNCRANAAVRLYIFKDNVLHYTLCGMGRAGIFWIFWRY